MWNRFRSVLKEKQKFKVNVNLGERLTRDIYSARLKEGLVKIGVKARRYDSHSGRIGGATMLWEAGYSDAQIMELGRWKSDSWKIYCRTSKRKFTKATRTIQSSDLVEKDLVFEQGKDPENSIGKSRRKECRVKKKRRKKLDDTIWGGSKGHEKSWAKK